MKVKVISLPFIFQVLYVLCFTRPRYQVSVHRTIGPLVCSFFCGGVGLTVIKSWALKNLILNSFVKGPKMLKRDSLTLSKVPLEVPGIA